MLLKKRTKWIEIAVFTILLFAIQLKETSGFLFLVCVLIMSLLISVIISSGHLRLFELLHTRKLSGVFILCILFFSTQFIGLISLLFFYTIVAGWLFNASSYIDTFASLFIVTFVISGYVVVSRSLNREFVAGAKKSPSKPIEFEQEFLIRIGSKLVMVSIDEIAYFYSDGGDTYVTTKENSSYPIDDSLDKVVLKLDPELFFRVNRKFLITRSSIEKMQTHSRSRTKLELKPSSNYEVVVTTEKNSSFKEWLISKNNN